ncbi:hypothetical protein PTE_03586 [Photorhabdus khanii NC19]|uniref:Uncharacterized protein n=1 Tax=Photorhabdus khanii NC19 TaxID=1004151 RepID=W3V342_9GAMM|nr:plasmid pRiA4b ORF-3 family protein [Photorhabdus khanii]ETS30247.1 hypothetical protein PTE_03586 [Photorhabdus khanii NC19]
MKAYIVKVALRGVSPMVWRRFRLSGETSLAAFTISFRSRRDGRMITCINSVFMVKITAFPILAELRLGHALNVQ